jgi:hypothetical protein
VCDSLDLTYDVSFEVRAPGATPDVKPLMLSRVEDVHSSDPVRLVLGWECLFCAPCCMFCGFVVMWLG